MDELSETDDLLHHMCKQIARQVEETDAEKRMKTQTNKKTVWGITDVIVNGAGLLKLAEEIKTSGEEIVSSSTNNFIQESQLLPASQLIVSERSERMSLKARI